eukprot:9488556-Pyramimonas_sp.AAC.1
MGLSSRLFRHGCPLRVYSLPCKTCFVVSIRQHGVSPRGDAAACRCLQEWDAKKAYILQRFSANSSIRVTPKFDVLVVGMKRNSIKRCIGA